MSRSNWTDDKLFYRVLNNKSDTTYWDNLRVLRHRPTKEVFTRSIALTYSENPKERRTGIHILAQLGSEPRPFYTESNKRYFELLDTEQDPEVMASLLSAIGHNNSKLSDIQVDKICQLSDSSNRLIKESLVHALLFINNTQAIETLIELSCDKLDYVRDWATFGLGQNERNNKKMREALWHRINDKHEDTRFEAITGLAAKKDKRVKEILMQELEKNDYSTSFLDVIVEYGNKDFLPLLRQHYEIACNDDETTEYWLGCLKDSISELSGKVER